MIFLYAITLFLSAALLFWMQPMFGKMVLPYFGSSPAVWSTCMVFFQAMLLIGYIYAHISIKYLGFKKQAILHSILLFLPFIVLPISIPAYWKPISDISPVFWLIILLLISVGLPFFVLSTTAPILQRWYSTTGLTFSKDPYFLYAASNAGSMLALIAYPFFLEPGFRLLTQSKLWLYFYVIFVFLLLACAFVLIKSGSTKRDEYQSDDSPNPVLKQKLKWLLYSFLPSSLLLGITTYFSTDISPVPLFWIVPLVVYLFTFILTFASKQIIPQGLLNKILPFVVTMVLFYTTFSEYRLWLTILIHLILFFVCAMICHGTLSQSRPSVKYLTEFYLWISAGGFLGGVFNAIIAPLIFKEVIEYPLVVVLVCLFNPLFINKETKLQKYLNFLLPIVPLIVGIGINFFLPTINVSQPAWFVKLLILGIPALICLFYSGRPMRFALSIGILVTFCMLYANYLKIDSKVLYVERNFFGVHRISQIGLFTALYQDTTLHGSQRVDQRNKCIPISYFYSTGPVGQYFNSLDKNNTPNKVAVVGLGTGALACYGKAEQEWTFYEIDPAVVKISFDSGFFTYLNKCLCKVNVFIGDGRLLLKQAPEHYYDLLILDAFSSDAIPLHLITKEAINLYFEKLTDKGVLVFHTSNRYLDLKRVLGNLADDAKLLSIVQSENTIDYSERLKGKSHSEWVILTKNKETLGKLLNDKKWKILDRDPKVGVWTDDFSNIFKIIHWGKV